jgi:hypothetical protein
LKSADLAGHEADLLSKISLRRLALAQVLADQLDPAGSRLGSLEMEPNCRPKAAQASDSVGRGWRTLSSLLEALPFCSWLSGSGMPQSLGR